MTQSKPITIGTVGLGGYAAAVCRRLRECGEMPEAYARLTAVCEPNDQANPDLAAELRSRGIPIFTQWDEFLTQTMDAVWLPLPIPLHRPYTEQALAAGKAVMCEKPAAGCLQDLDAMRTARDRAQLPVAIGFQDIYQPTTLAMKRALLAGRIGQIHTATLMACWPRDSRYYGRSDWAGRLKQGENWILDSPANNALAHFINLVLFLLGDREETSASLVSVEAELYRANPIENYDTCALRLVTESKVSFVVLLTHACDQLRPVTIQIQGEQGTIDYEAEKGIEIRTADAVERISLNSFSHFHMIERFANLVRGVKDERLIATLEVARAHTIAVNGASEASPVHTVSETFLEMIPQENDGVLRSIVGIEELFAACLQNQCLPHESGLAAWTSPAGRRDLTDYRQFLGVPALDA